MVMFALPILDTALAFTPVNRNQRPLFSRGSAAFSSSAGGPRIYREAAVLISYGAGDFFGVMGVRRWFSCGRGITVAIYLVIFGSIIVAAYKMGMVHENPLPSRAGEPLGDVPMGRSSQR